MTTPYSTINGRSLLKLADLSGDELHAVLQLADELKAAKAAGQRGQRLAQRNIALLFEKLSTRTRCAVTVAAVDEGASVEYLAASEIHLGKKESVADTARVLGRMFDGIMFRGFKHGTAEALAEFAGIPVWNGLTDDYHPTQTLADLMTIREHFGRLEGLKVAYLGDGRNNVANSLMRGCAQVGIHFVNGTPDSLRPSAELVEQCEAIAAQNGGSVSIESDPLVAVKGANVVYTDVWVSMGEEDVFDERVALLRPYQVNMDLMKATGLLESNETIFLHCLPAFHDHNTEFTKDGGALEVTDDVFEAPFSKVFDLAENRMHTIKAIMVASLERQESGA